MGRAAESRADVVVLCYHAVSDRWQAAMAVTPAQLAQHVCWLAASGYRFISFHQAATAPPPGRSAAITFDDAYRSVFDLAWPILDERQIAATVFAPTDLVGGPKPMSWPEIARWHEAGDAEELVPMSWAQLGELAAGGWEVGSHTCSHAHLTRLQRPAIGDELERSKAAIEDRLGTPCESLAYPYGEHDAGVAAAAREAGYSAGAGTARYGLARGADPLRRPRLVVNRVDGPRRFRAKVSPLARRAMASRLWRRRRAARKRAPAAGGAGQ